MKIGTKTHYCADSRQVGSSAFGRIVNMYVHLEGKWKSIGKICMSCGDHWINDVGYSVPRSEKSASRGKTALG